MGDTHLGVICGVDRVGRSSGSAALVVGIGGSAASSGGNSGQRPPPHFLRGDGNNGCLGGVVRARSESLRAVSRLAAAAAAAETVGNVRRVEELEGPRARVRAGRSTWMKEAGRQSAQSGSLPVSSILTES